MNLFEIPMGDNEVNAPTVGHYLIEMLATLWSEGDDFSAKRPFGESGWDWEIARAVERGTGRTWKVSDITEAIRKLAP